MRSASLCSRSRCRETHGGQRCRSVSRRLWPYEEQDRRSVLLVGQDSAEGDEGVPGICRMRQQPASLAAICSSLSVSSSICSSTVLHSFQRMSIRLPIIGVSALSAFSRTSAIATLSFAGFSANTVPRSKRKALIWLMIAVRRDTSRSRIRCVSWRRDRTQK